MKLCEQLEVVLSCYYDKVIVIAWNISTFSYLAVLGYIAFTRAHTHAHTPAHTYNTHIQTDTHTHTNRHTDTRTHIQTDTQTQFHYHIAISICYAADYCQVAVPYLWLDFGRPAKLSHYRPCIYTQTQTHTCIYTHTESQTHTHARTHRHRHTYTIHLYSLPLLFGLVSHRGSLYATSSAGPLV